MPPSTMRCCGIRDNQRFEAPFGDDARLMVRHLSSDHPAPMLARSLEAFLGVVGGDTGACADSPFTFCPPKFVESVAPGLFRDRVVGRERRVSRVLCL